DAGICPWSAGRRYLDHHHAVVARGAGDGAAHSAFSYADALGERRVADARCGCGGRHRRCGGDLLSEHAGGVRQPAGDAAEVLAVLLVRCLPHLDLRISRVGADRLDACPLRALPQPGAVELSATGCSGGRPRMEAWPSRSTAGNAPSADGITPRAATGVSGRRIVLICPAWWLWKRETNGGRRHQRTD